MDEKVIPNRRVVDEFDKLEVGKTYHYLTCLAVCPPAFRCVCGKEVYKRNVNHLNNGLRSCGCKRVEHRQETILEAIERRGMKPIKRLTNDLPARKQEWLLQCSKCDAFRVLKGSTILAKRTWKKCSGLCRPNRSSPRRNGDGVDPRVAPTMGEEP